MKMAFEYIPHVITELSITHALTMIMAFTFGPLVITTKLSITNAITMIMAFAYVPQAITT